MIGRYAAASAVIAVAVVLVLASGGTPWVIWLGVLALVALAGFILTNGELIYRHVAPKFSDPFAESAPSPLLLKETAICLWDGVTLGYLAAAKPLRFFGQDTSMLIAGETGSGKTVFLTNIISAMALDPRVQFALFDGKGSLEFSRWDGIAEHIDISGDPGPLLTYLTKVYQEMRRRQEILKGLDKVKLDKQVYLNDLPLFYVVIDELAAYTKTFPNKKLGQSITQMLGKIAAQGRSVGVLLILATQHPSTEVVESIIRNNIAMRVCFRVATVQASNMVLGQGLAKQGYDASVIRMIDDRGIGYARLEGYWPKKFRSCLLEYQDTKPIAIRARAIRAGIELPALPQAPQDASAESPDALPSRSLVDDIKAVFGNADRLHNSIVLSRLQSLDSGYYGHWSQQLFGRRLRDVGLAPHLVKWTEGDRRNHTGIPASALEQDLGPDDGVTPSERRREREALAMEALDEVGRMAYEARLAEIEAATNCEYCRKPLTLENPPTVDHWQPLAKGGTNDASNLRAACGSCNSSKRDHDPVTWLHDRIRKAA